jgi:DHA1 family multidrug resistance protein-like MFS transporter
MQRKVWILAFVLTVVTLGFGLVIPIIPFYMESLGAGGAELGLLVASYALMRLVFGPIWGSLSDRIGRKPVLMVGILGYGITMIFFGLSTRLWMLFVTRILSGILSSATSPTTLAYISDSTSEKDRGKGMGVLGAAMGVGTILGPGMGGLLGESSYAMPFFIAGGMSLLSLLLVAIFLPESLSIEARAAQECQSGVRKNGLDLLRSALSEHVLRSIGILLFMAFLSSYALTTFFGIFGLYALKRFGYGAREVGLVLMVVGMVSSLAQGVLTGPSTKRWGEASVIKLSLLFSSLGFVFIVVVQDFVGVLFATGFFTLASALLTPAVMSLTSKESPLEQGITMGLSNSFVSLGRIAGPSLAGFLFDASYDLPFWGGALIMLVGFISGMAKLTNKQDNTI